MRKILLLIAISMLTGCSFLSPSKSTPSKTYILTKVPFVAKSTSHPHTLFIAMPDTAPLYNTTQMAYSTRPYQVAYFADNEWVETPGQMFQPLLVQTLQNTGFFHAVITPPSIGHYDYLLNTQILALHQDFNLRPNRLRMVVGVQLSKAATNRVIATRVFSVDEPIATATPYGGVLAANRATATILRKIANFCTKTKVR